jgi:tripartite-type tricarboxylate transporter receptor subunit TctC
MKQRRFCLAFATLWALAILLPVSLQAKSYPERPVTIIASTPAGNGPDIIARIIADGLTRLWKQPVVVENRPGGRGIVATLAVIRAPHDGYTLYITLGSTYTVLPEIRKKLPFDLERDLVPIGMAGGQPFLIAVDPKLGVASLGALIARAKAHPADLFYGSIRGSLPHLVMERFLSLAGVKMTLVPYSTTSKIIADTMGGRIAVAIESLSGMRGVIRSGQLRGLAVTSAKRVADFPDLPTVAETFPGFEGRGWFALTAPAGTPDAVVQKVSRDLRTILKSPDVAARFAKFGTYAQPMSPSETAAFIRQQRATWSPVIRRIGLMSK